MMAIELPFCIPEKFLLLQNDTKQKEGEPDYRIIKNFTIGKGVEIGGIWNKVSDKGNSYKSITFEHPMGDNGWISMAAFNLEQRERVADASGKERVLIAVVNYSGKRQPKNNDYAASAQQDYS